jgi:nucleoside-diphosphate-sugar epimerase
MSRFLLTGARGYVGSALLPALLERGDVLAISRREAPNDGAHWLRHDLASPLPQLPERTGATIVHCAGAIRSNDAEELRVANVEGMRNVLNWASRHESPRVIVFSTGAVYGYRDGQRAREDDPLQPSGHYATSKKLAEDVCGEYSIPVIIFRLYLPFGRGGGITQRVEDAVRAGSALQLHRDGAPRMTPIHLDDVVTAVLGATDDRFTPGIYNLCGDEDVSFGVIVEMTEQRLGLRATLEHTGESPGDMMGSNEKLRATGWRPRESVLRLSS